jgi:gluconate kinase
LAFQGGDGRSVKYCPTVVVFGKPGAGKTTVADAAIEMLKKKKDVSLECLGLDLDVCVPQWMKDNFAKGQYPTLEERNIFASEVCDYVEKQLEENLEKVESDLAAVVSFSFVNTDLRDNFRTRFPQAKWVLIDTDDAEATKRINERKGHFYTGNADTKDGDDSPVEEEKKEPNRNNSDWNFAPVTFPHVILEGNYSIDVNAEKVLEVLMHAAGLEQP